MQNLRKALLESIRFFLVVSYFVVMAWVGFCIMVGFFAGAVTAITAFDKDAQQRTEEHIDQNWPSWIPRP